MYLDMLTQSFWSWAVVIKWRSRTAQMPPAFQIFTLLFRQLHSNSLHGDSAYILCYQHDFCVKSSVLKPNLVISLAAPAEKSKLIEIQGKGRHSTWALHWSSRLRDMRDRVNTRPKFKARTNTWSFEASGRSGEAFQKHCGVNILRGSWRQLKFISQRLEYQDGVWEMRWNVGGRCRCRYGVSLSKFVIRVGFIVPLGADLSMKPFGECSF